MANNPHSDAIEAAINSALPNLDDHKEGDMLLDWIVVAYVANADPEAGSGYPMLFSNGNMPSYRAIGLLTMGMVQLENNLDDD